jgi:hypothetical protein
VAEQELLAKVTLVVTVLQELLMLAQEAVALQQ